MSVVICHDCQRPIDTDWHETFEVDGHDICTRCAEGNYEWCEECEKYFDPSDHANCPRCGGIEPPPSGFYDVDDEPLDAEDDL